MRALRNYQEQDSTKKLIWETSENDQHFDQHWQLSVRMMNEMIQTLVRTVMNDIMNQSALQWSHKFRHDQQTKINSVKIKEHVQGKQIFLKKKKKQLALKEIWKWYNCERSEHLSQQCKKFCNSEKKIITTISHNSLSWTACQNDMCRVYISNKNEAEWYSQKWQKKCEMYNMTEVSTKEIIILDWINVKEVNIHSI